MSYYPTEDHTSLHALALMLDDLKSLSAETPEHDLSFQLKVARVLHRHEYNAERLCRSFVRMDGDLPMAVELSQPVGRLLREELPHNLDCMLRGWMALWYDCMYDYVVALSSEFPQVFV